MRAIVLLCLLHIAFGQYHWDGPLGTTVAADPIPESVCLTDQASCGCCLIKTQMERMELFFNYSAEALSESLTKPQMLLNNMRASRSAFSVALTNDPNFIRFGPFTSDTAVAYKHVFINLGGSYNTQTGTFTVPRSGVYSLTVTMYATVTSGDRIASCGSLQVNDKTAAILQERIGQDGEDSVSAILAQHLKAGDQVYVSLHKGFAINDNNSHYNTFTGFLVYASD